MATSSVAAAGLSFAIVSVTETRREGGREVTRTIDASAGAPPAWDQLRRVLSRDLAVIQSSLTRP
jgi:hypothetical protein